jgi:hypothetical protein
MIGKYATKIVAQTYANTHTVQIATTVNADTNSPLEFATQTIQTHVLTHLGHV